MMDSATNRKKRRVKKDLLSLDILKILKGQKTPISTQEIAEELNKPWHSIQTRCLRLQIEEKLNGFRVGRINLWQKKDE